MTRAHVLELAEILDALDEATQLTSLRAMRQAILTIMRDHAIVPPIEQE